MKKMMKMLFLFLIPLSTLNALELGDIKLDSYLNEPLKASFTLGHIDTDHVGDVLISLADQDSYRSFGITKPFVLNQIKFKISADRKDRYLVDVSTQKRIKDPILDLLVKVTEKQGSVTRLYTLILDPRDAFNNDQLTASPIAKDQNSTASTTDDTSTKTVQPVNQQPTNGSAPTRIKVVHDSISMLAQNSEFHEKYSVYQIMRAYYLLNEDAFSNGNINHLKAGVTLVVPDEALISEVSRQQSINFVYAASKNNPFKKTVTDPDRVISRSTVQSSKISEKVITDLEPQNSIENEQAVTPEKSIQNTPEQPLASAQDQTQLTTSTNELSARQQKIITQQQAEIDELKQTLSSKLDEIESINFRLNALEIQNASSAVVKTTNDAEIPPPPVVQVETVKEDIKQESYSYIITWAAAFIVLLLLINREIVWRRRLKELDAYIPQSQKETVKDDKQNNLVSEEINHVSKSDKTSKATPLEAGQNQINLDDVFAKTIVEEIHYKPRSNYIPDKNHIETIEYKPVIDEKDDSIDADLDFNLEFDDDELDPTDEMDIVEHTLEIDDESLETINLQLADEKFHAAISAAKTYKNKDSNTFQSLQDENRDPQILYSEIDVLIAYELYEEAYELIKKSREDYLANKNDLDIRELEILAYLKNAELFFPMFDLLKGDLSKDYPVEWKKITELREQMKPPGPKLKAVF